MWKDRIYEPGTVKDGTAKDGCRAALFVAEVRCGSAIKSRPAEVEAQDEPAGNGLHVLVQLN